MRHRNGPRFTLTNEEMVDIALGARDRVAAAWTKGALARRAPDPNAPKGTAASRGASTLPQSDDAEEWCALGAARAAAPKGWWRPWTDAPLLEAFRAAGIISAPTNIQGWNDRFDRTQDEVVGAFDELARWLKDTGWTPQSREAPGE